MTSRQVKPKRTTTSSGSDSDFLLKNKAKKNVSGIDAFITRNIKQGNGDPTDAYGQIEFGGNTTNTAKYVKVSNATSVEIIHQLITRHWKLQTPSLIISVTGGEKNFSLRTRLKEMFRSGLIHAAETTGAWITTGGTRTGVTKHVGMAVEQYAAIKDDAKRVVTIGVAPWGIIHQRNVLLNHKQADQKIPKVYDAEDGFEGSGNLLDRNHSHFILVDNGREDDRDRVSDIKGSEIELRTKLESYLGGLQTSRRVNVLIVCVIVQGDSGSLKTVVGSIRNKTPVVIVEGSGGWADILANASSMNEKQMDRDVLAELITECGMDVDEANLDDWTEMVKECTSRKDLLNVFCLDPTDLSRDLDIAILEALLQANSNDVDVALSQQQLNLAIAWDRSDIAQSYILTDDACLPKKAIAKLFCGVLEGNKHEFCKVFLNFGVDLKQHFTVKDLHFLYKSAPKNLVFYKKLCKRNFSLQGVGKLMLDYVGKSYISVYKKRQPDSPKYCAISDVVNNGGKLVPDNSGQNVEGWSYRCKLDDPYREIFQWAILFNYREIAMHVFKHMHGSTQAAIVASQMLKVLASQMERDQETKHQMKDDADEYEMLATEIFSKCYLENPFRSYIFLISPLREWGNYTCLHLAIEANDTHFVSCPGVQSAFERVWTNGLAGNSWLHIIAAGLFPPLTVTTIRYHESDDVVEDSAPVEESDIESHDTSRIEDEENNVGFSNTNYTEPGLAVRLYFWFMFKIARFYDAPIVTFWLSLFFFLVYLGLFAYVVLSGFQLNAVSVSAWEYLLLAWSSTFLLEEFRRLINQEARYFKERLQIHMLDPWNVMDLIGLVLFYIGFGLRYDIRYLDVALTLYAIAFMVQCMRLVQIFAIDPILGPKISMIRKMLKDLWFFLFIMIVFALAYGVASQALLYPSETNFSDIVQGILSRPYWQIYGELYLDEIDYNPNAGALTCSDTDAGLPRCPRATPVVPVMSALYLLFANVLLLNLLIAMFGSTYDKINDQNYKVWLFHRYHLITDYYLRPPLVPPFIILYHIYLFLAFVYRKISSRMEHDDPFCRVWRVELSEEAWKNLLQWEHWHAKEFAREKQREGENEVDHQLVKISERMESMTTTLEDLEQRIRTLSHSRRNVPIKPKADRGGS